MMNYCDNSHFLFRSTGISYITHPQANPIRVSDFRNIEKITTTILHNSNAHMQTEDGTHSNNVNLEAEKTSISPSLHNKFNEGDTNQCTCNEIKTLLKIKVKGNSDDLAITCNGVKTADSIADLVDGYCRILNNTNISFWERLRSPIHTISVPTKEPSKPYEESQQSSIMSQVPITLFDTSNTESSEFQFE